MRFLAILITLFAAGIQLRAQNTDIFIEEKTDSIIQLCVPLINTDSIQHYMQELEDMETLNSF